MLVPFIISETSHFSRNTLKRNTEYNNHLLSWCENFMEKHSFHRNYGDCVSVETAPFHKISAPGNFGILFIRILALFKHLMRLAFYD